MNPQGEITWTSENIYEDLCRKIETLVYMPGTKLSENELFNVYGVTRHVIRNAFSRLKQRRLLEVYPQRGSYVSLIDMEYIANLMYIRESVEQEAVFRIIRMEDRGEIILKLRQAIKAQKNVTPGTSYWEEFYEQDNLFHQTLLASVGKPDVMNLISGPYIHIRRWRNYEIRSEERMREIVTEHESVLTAIEEGNWEEARKQLHFHLDTINRCTKPLKEKEAQYFLIEK